VSEIKTVRIVSDGHPFKTKVTDLESNEIHARAIRLDWNWGKQDFITEIEVVLPRLDITTEATLTPRCPYCGRSDDE
jgi:hypothetical protein